MPGDADGRNRPPLADSASGLYVQYGCGLCAPDRWLNFDASPRLWLERAPAIGAILRVSLGALFPRNVRYGDVVAGLPLPDDTAAGIYCSHVLEHLPRDDVPAALRETLRVLRPGGRFRLVVPDLRWRARRYVEAANAEDPEAADRYLDSCMLGTRAAVRTPLGIIRRHFGRGAHLWLYDFAAMRTLIAAAGFVAIRECALGDSDDPRFAQVEEADRFFVGAERELAIEARKPAQSAQVAASRRACGSP
jgi:SAM-dependent methyltransferase